MGLDLDYINGQMFLDEEEKDGLPFKISIIRKKYTPKYL